MLHQLVANCVCVLFGVEQLVSTGFLQLFYGLQRFVVVCVSHEKAFSDVFSLEPRVRLWKHLRIQRKLRFSGLSASTQAHQSVIAP